MDMSSSEPYSNLHSVPGTVKNHADRPLEQATEGRACEEDSKPFSSKTQVEETSRLEERASLADQHAEAIRKSSGGPWIDPKFISTLETVNHQVEIFDEAHANARWSHKIEKLRTLIKSYHCCYGQPLVVVAARNLTKPLLNFVHGSFPELDVAFLDTCLPEGVKSKLIANFQRGENAIIVVPSEISTKGDCCFRSGAVLINFDFPKTVQLYLYRIFQKVDAGTHVYTFFSIPEDARLASLLATAMLRAKQSVPHALSVLHDQAKAEQNEKLENGGSNAAYIRQGKDKGRGKHEGKGTDKGKAKGKGKGKSKGKSKEKSDEVLEESTPSAPKYLW